MIILLSPAKSMNFDPVERNSFTKPRFPDETALLVNKLRRTSKKKLKEMMSISDDLASLNKERYDNFEMEHTTENSKPSIYAFRGDVYVGLNADGFDKEDIEYAQPRVRILSGLYGVLRPKDLIQPYRLEMGTRMPVRRKRNIEEFWRDRITTTLNEDLKASGFPAFVNLASNEYFSAINKEELDAPVYRVNFKEWRNGKLRFIQFNLKKARGLMTRWIIENRVDDPDKLSAFDLDGYAFDSERSGARELLFTRMG